MEIVLVLIEVFFLLACVLPWKAIVIIHKVSTVPICVSKNPMCWCTSEPTNGSVSEVI